MRAQFRPSWDGLPGQQAVGNFLNNSVVTFTACARNAYDEFMHGVAYVPSMTRFQHSNLIFPLRMIAVPRVFINGKFIGGGDDTVRLARTGELQRLVSA